MIEWCKYCGEGDGVCEKCRLRAEVRRLEAEAKRAAPVLEKALEIAKWWRVQDGIAALALEELSDAAAIYNGTAQAEGEEPEG